MKYRVTLALLLAGCATPAPQPEQVATRQAPPLLERVEPPPSQSQPPARSAGVAFAVSAALAQEAREILRHQARSTRVEHSSGIAWADGSRSLFVTHQHFPANDMSEADHARAIDEAVIERCDAEFVCATDDCDDMAYEICMKGAYSNPYVYMASLGLDCGVYELSRFDIVDDRLVLRDRAPLASVACGLTTLTDAPTGSDVDNDGGPELTYAWSSVDYPTPESQQWQFATVIVDATTLREQLRWRRSAEQDDLTRHVHKLTLVPREDGFADIVANAVTLQEPCIDAHWALGPPFVTHDEQDPLAGTCDIAATTIPFAYDVAADKWTEQR